MLLRATGQARPDPRHRDRALPALECHRVFGFEGSGNLTRDIPRDYSPRGVQVTSLNLRFLPLQQNRQIMEQTPIVRFGEPPEAVGAALLPAARDAGCLTIGAGMFVDGGFTGMRYRPLGTVNRRTQAARFK
ncbi:MAG: hypothetical protein OXN97_13855 [Bryobacterales bacterium]|nr:hypothetical protein [Bryobacterales bacterium]